MAGSGIRATEWLRENKSASYSKARRLSTLTSAENYDIASNDYTLAIVMVRSSLVSFFNAAQERPHNPIGKNCDIPPSIITAPTARLTSRL